jgi:hypothetical protein
MCAGTIACTSVNGYEDEYTVLTMTNPPNGNNESITAQPVGVQLTAEYRQVSSEELSEYLEGAVMLYLNSPIAYVDGAQAFIDESNPNAAPTIIDGRTLVPLRFIAEAFGAEVAWEADTETAKITFDGKLITVKHAEKVLFSNGEPIAMDVAAAILDGRVYVPLRAYAEAIGKEVFFSDGLIAISNNVNLFDINNDKTVIRAIIGRLNNLPIIGTKERFMELAGFSGSDVFNYRHWTPDIDASFPTR